MNSWVSGLVSRLVTLLYTTQVWSFPLLFVRLWTVEPHHDPVGPLEVCHSIVTTSPFCDKVVTNDVTNIETIDLQRVAMISGRKDDLSHIDLSHCDTLVTNLVKSL